MASDHSTTLAEVFYQVPQLISECALACSTRWEGIRAMRLVCKSLASFVGHAVRSCSVQIGDGASPDPHQVIRVMGSSLLLDLDVTVIVRTGMGGPSEFEQLATCSVHTSQLLHGMSPAIKQLKHLHLSVLLVPHNRLRLLDLRDSSCNNVSAFSNLTCKYKRGRSSLHIDERNVKGNDPEHCPVHMEQIPRTVFEMLAAKLPNLHHLSLLGHCGDGALGVFGANCPELHTMQFEASSVPMKALHHLHTHVPNLWHVSLTRRGNRGSDLQKFTVAMFAALKSCTSLKSLEIDFGEKAEIICKAYEWHNLSRQLLALRCNCPLPGFRNAIVQFRKLQLLEVLASPCSDLVYLLRRVPCLLVLTVQQTEYITLNLSHLLNTDGSPADDLPSLQHQLCTMRISCPSFLLKADIQNVRALLTWLQPIPATKLSIETWSLQASPLNFLEHVPTVFECLTTFELMDLGTKSAQYPPSDPISEAWLAPLVQCKSLQQLFLYAQVSLTTAGLSELCMNLPFLEKIKCYACEGLNPQEFGLKVHRTRPNFKLNYICSR